MAAVYLEAAFGRDAAGMPLDFVRRTAPRWGPILKMADSGLNSPLTSSAGRLFDAAAAVTGLADTVTYEGQAAIELEQLADPVVTRAYSCSTEGQIDGKELIGALAADLMAGRPAPEAAAAFHNGLAAALVTVACRAAEAHAVSTVALSGGTFQNRLLASRVAGALQDRGLEVLTHRRVPPNDGGICLGQAVVANARNVER